MRHAQDLITYRAIECVGAPTQVGRTQHCKCDMHEAHKRSMNQRVGIPVTQTIGEVLDRRGLVRSGDTEAAKLCSPCLQERGRRWGRYIISKRRRKGAPLLHTIKSFSGNLAWYIASRYSIGVLSYGSWSAECCEYLASFKLTCLEIVPSHGCRAPVIRCSSVDFPVPFAPRIAIRESMLQIAMRSAPTEKRQSSLLNTEGKLFIQVVFLLSRVRECDIVECNDRRRQPANALEVEAQRLSLFDLLYQPRRLHLIDDLLLRLRLLHQVRVRTG